jgi:hypothetical protein
VEDYGKVWRDRRRRVFDFRSDPIVFFSLILVLAFLQYRHIQIPGFPIRIGWIGVYGAAGIWLNRFGCPRCGRLYYWKIGILSRTGTWRCHHCGCIKMRNHLLGFE